MVSPMSRLQIEQLAEAVLEQYMPESLLEPGRIDVLHVFEYVLGEIFHLDVGVEELAVGVEGITWPDGRVLVSPETYEGVCQDRGRPRFTMAHECCHGLYHARQIRHALIDVGELVLYRRPSVVAYRDPEWQANAFAAALLMPKPMVRAIAGDGPIHRKIRRVADKFFVSPPAANIRLKHLGLGSP